MLRKLFITLILLAAGFTALLKWGDLSGAIRALESLLRPVVHKEIINRYCGLYKEDPIFVMSIIKVESNFLHGAKSRRGAVGLMQIMPATAAEIAREVKANGFKASDLENPDINIQFGVYYVSKLRKEFGDDDPTVLAAYNAGRKNVQDWLKSSGRKNIELEGIEFIETRNFVKDVLWNYSWLKRFQKWRGELMKEK